MYNITHFKVLKTRKLHQLHIRSIKKPTVHVIVHRNILGTIIFKELPTYILYLIT